MQVSSETKAPSKRLKEQALSASLLNVTARISSFAINFIATLVLARILAPGDFGLVGMVMPVISVFGILGNMGLTMAVLQRREIEPKQLSSLFYMNIGVSFVLALTLYFLAPVLSAFYDTPQVYPITQLFSLVILAAGAGALQTTLLQRNLRFGSILIAEILAEVGASAAAVVLALEGFGFMALAWRAVLQPSIYTTVVWLSSGWLPGKAEWSPEVKSMFRFGGFSAGFNILNTAGRQLDNVLIGWRYGHAELGPYAVAYRLFFTPLRMVTAPLGQVAIPTLSRMQDDPERFARWYLSILRLITLAVFPPLFAMVLFTDDLVQLVLGSKWEAAAPIIQWLLPVGAMQASYTTIGWIMIAIGRADRQFKWATIAIPLYVAGFALGLRWGAEGVAMSYAVTNSMLFIPGFIFGTYGTQIRLGQIFSALTPGVLTACAAVVLLLGAMPLFGQMEPLPKLAIAGTATLIIMAIATLLVFGRAAVLDNVQRVATIWK